MLHCHCSKKKWGQGRGQDQHEKICKCATKLSRTCVIVCALSTGTGLGENFFLALLCIPVLVCFWQTLPSLWHGHSQHLVYHTCLLKHAYFFQDMQDDCGPCRAPQSRAGAGKRPRHLPHRQNYAKLHRLTQLLDTGQIASVFQELECDLDPDFLPANPELLFELHR